MPLSTREKILTLGEKYMLTQGYNAFSYHDISLTLGIKNAAVHYHFPKKEDLGESVILKAMDRFKEWSGQIDQMEIPYSEKFERFIKEVYDIRLDQEHEVCLVGSIATDYHSVPDILKSQIRSLADGVYAWLTNFLETGRSESDLDFQGKAADRAAMITATMAGALQLSRLLGKDKYFEIKKQLIKDLT